MQLPRITVVTPSYNQGRFIEATIRSVINQNYPNLEYFIVDGGSTDDTLELIKKYEHRIDWWVSEKDEGQSDAIFKGFERATGDLLGWLNSDDVYFPGALKAIGKAYVESPVASIYTGGNATGKKNDGRIEKCSLPTRPLKILGKYGLTGFGQQSSFFSASAYRQIGGLNRKLYIRMDGDLFYRLMQNNPRTMTINKMVGFFRWHETSKSTLCEDRYRMERDEFVKSLKISMSDFQMLNHFFRLYRFLRGGYTKSWFITQLYKNKRMSQIWHDHLED